MHLQRRRVRGARPALTMNRFWLSPPKWAYCPPKEMYDVLVHPLQNTGTISNCWLGWQPTDDAQCLPQHSLKWIPSSDSFNWVNLLFMLFFFFFNCSFLTCCLWFWAAMDYRSKVDSSISNNINKLIYLKRALWKNVLTFFFSQVMTLLSPR